MNGCKNEIVKGIALVGANTAPTGSAVNLASLFPAGAVQNFNEITVFNDSDQGVKVLWTNDTTGLEEFFLVPKGGKSYTRKLNKGGIASATLKVFSTNNSAAAVGTITINLALN